MKLPKFFRKFTPISAVTMVLAMAAWMLSSGVQLNLLAVIFQFLFVIALISFFVSLIGLLVFRSIENALLRRFGKSATATVLAVTGTNESVNNVGVYRVRLEVHPSGSQSFISVAEDAIRMANMVGAGDTVSVKYDPRTKEVALVLPRQIKTKREDF